MSSNAESQTPIQSHASAADTLPGAKLMDQVQVIAERPGGLLEGYVSIDLIDQEEVVVDPAHVAELAASMTRRDENGRETGQLSAVILGQLAVRPSFAIIDGFHRTGALREIRRQTVYATFRQNCSPEELLDLRIISASSHKKVKFPRIIEWVEQAWGLTPWASKGFSSLSAFTLAASDKNGERSGLQPDEITAVKEWVRAKCEHWRITPWTVQGFLRTARGADPRLIKMVEEKNHRLRSSASSALSTKQLAVIVQYLAGEYDLQQMVVAATQEHQLTVSQTKALSSAVSRAPDLEAIQKCFTDRVWRSAPTERKNMTQMRYGEIDVNAPETYVGAIVDGFFDNEIAIAELLIQVGVLRGVFAPKPAEISATVNDVIIRAGLAVEQPAERVAEVEQQPPDGVTPNPIEDLPLQERKIPDTAAIEELARQIMSIRPECRAVVRRITRSWGSEDVEDMLSISTLKFLERVQDGRLPATYDNEALKRLLAKFVTFATIDVLRARNGRDGSRHTLSIQHENANGVSIQDILQAEDQFSDVYHSRSNHRDFLKRLLPLLTANERRVAILRMVYDLSDKQIAAIMGVKHPSVTFYFSTLKKKAAKLIDDLQSGEFV